MREQLLRIADLATRPTVDVQVIRFAAGAHPGIQGSFAILGFAPGDSEIVYVEGMAGLPLSRAADRVVHRRCSVEESSRSGDNGNRVEVRRADPAVQVRDSKDRSGPVLTSSPTAWAAFLADVRATTD